MRRRSRSRLSPRRRRGGTRSASGARSSRRGRARPCRRTWPAGRLRRPKRPSAPTTARQRRSRPRPALEAPTARRTSCQTRRDGGRRRAMRERGCRSSPKRCRRFRASAAARATARSSRAPRLWQRRMAGRAASCYRSRFGPRRRDRSKRLLHRRVRLRRRAERARRKRIWVRHCRGRSREDGRGRKWLRRG